MVQPIPHADKTTIIAKDDVNFGLKLYSKKLASGRCQVKFYVNTAGQKRLYGYTLVEAHTTLKEVVKTITDRIRRQQRSDSYHHAHLFALGKKQEDWTNFMIFEI
ncbi:hypothetical protein QQ020_18850 [Fulvivirgaceae bacterium BMA12]|uniref:Uncharacterized protein n=1 Tax=Agaribacillus aureus TaxID=3051825 RepID=A0ABT8LCV6_9BACT|nr:hypothetical protein [Fulvivirgaceae bacterium BMA12]